MKFKRDARVWRQKIDEFVDLPHEMVKQGMRDGTALPSLAVHLLQDQERQGLDEESENLIKWMSNSVYGGGSDTIVSVIATLILALVLHPEVLKKAHEEIDNIIGKKRLPAFEDRPLLPYIECVVNETLRWGVPAPLAPLHRLMEEDHYNGWVIPKGTYCAANIWQMCRDENTYPDPEEFRPERFLEMSEDRMKKEGDPRLYVFGFGRRRCPGIFLMDPSVWFYAVSLMAAFDFSKATAADGNEVEPGTSFDYSGIRHPKPFKCVIKPRSTELDRLIRQATGSESPEEP